MKLIEELLPPRGYPLDAEEASKLIVARLLSDLPAERRKEVQEIIYEWASERESAVASTTYELSLRG